MRRTILLRSTSAAVLASLMVVAMPAHAQLAARRGPALGAPTLSKGANPGQIRTRAQTDALDRQAAVQTRAQQIRTYVNAARDAAARSVPNGLEGLVVADGVNVESLASGALRAAVDSTGRRTWQGANLPSASIANGGTLVTVDQTEARAILSWKRFDVGAETTLQFNQKQGGTVQADWVAINRVVDPGAAPSQILGKIKADATVVVINRNGVIFGKGAQVRAGSLLASTLDIGNFVKATSRVNPTTGLFELGFGATTLQDRNVAFLQNGLLSADVAQTGVTLAGTLTSSLAEGFARPTLEAVEGTLTAPREGGVVVERGASLAAGTGGYVMLTGPTVSNDGAITATEGQVSLQAGRAITAKASTGAQNGADPGVRGLVLRSSFGGADDAVVNSGLVESHRGYASLGAGMEGTVVNAGLIAATTSVSRNGTIDLTAGTVTLAGAASRDAVGGLVITPDGNGETIPQGTPASPANFKTSLIRIGAAYLDPLLGASDPLGEIGPGRIAIGSNALIYAPSAKVEIGGAAGQTFSATRYASTAIPGALNLLADSRIDIADGALIDVSGVKDLTLSMSRNSLKIDPVKRNELRDTPTYREVNTEGKFTLNGATIYVDPRITGVRDDGVAWVGSPLIEAGSAASQIGVTAAELMTRGGTVSLNVGVLESAADAATAPAVRIGAGATIDFSGGWVRYLDGVVRSSRLLTWDGRVIDISAADRNDRFVAVAEGYTKTQSSFGISRTYSNPILTGSRFEYGYDEGRDAGALLVGASSAVLDGTLHGDAFAGLHQLADARRSGAAPTLAGDPRKLQSTVYEIPAGGYLRVGAADASGVTELAGDIVVGTDQALAPGSIRLDDAMLNAAGLSGLSLRTSGSVTLEEGSHLHLAPGGALQIEAGRSVLLRGDVTAAGGTIAVKTTDFGKDIFGASQGSVGSPFTTADDLAGNYATAPGLDPFDIVVTGTLSTAGIWANDFVAGPGHRGGAWINGGSISLTVAPNVFVGVGGTIAQPLAAADLSGSIVIAQGALLDVSAGGYVGVTGKLDLTGTGGNVSLINATRYASTSLTDTNVSNDSRNSVPIGGTNQTVTFTPYTVGQTRVVSALVPADPSSDVRFDVSSLRGFGFAGGGTFTLVAPDIAMGNQSTSAGPRIGLDFLARTGFGTLNLTANKSRFIDGLFANGVSGRSAFLDTERFVIGAGETLDLTQILLPSVLDLATIDRIAALETDGDVYSLLTPGVPADVWDRKAANLVLGGLTELDVLQGGSIVGAAGASITIPRLYSAGTIRIAGGRINQVDTLELLLPADRVVGVLDRSLGGAGIGAIFGGATDGQENGFDENALTTLPLYRDPARTQRLTNGQVFSYVSTNASLGSLDVNVVYTGLVALNEGIHLTGTSVTDLSGTVIYNPRAAFLPRGPQLQLGRMVAGGSISTSRFGSENTASGYASAIDPSNLLNAETGARIALDGASGAFDVRLTTGRYTRAAQWSDGGSLIVGSGASLAGATITAFGGDDGDSDPARTAAAGGVLDWVSPTIVQSRDDLAENPTRLSANQLMGAGFSTLVTRNGFTVEGALSLNLSKAFIATTDTIDGARTTEAMDITAGTGADALIVAPYIRLSSSRRKVVGNATSSGVGSITLQSTGTLDVVGAVEFNVGAVNAGGTLTRGLATLIAKDDIRLIGTAGIPNVQTGLFDVGLDGQLVSNGDLTLRAAQVYATTGTGNLQQLLEARLAGKPEAPSPYVIGSTASGGTVRFEGQGSGVPATPYSAGTHLAVRGANIVQNGVLRAPLGMIELGSNTAVTLNGSISTPVTQALELGVNSLTSDTARSGGGALSIPYGTTTDLIEYFFTPGSTQVLTTMPSGQLSLAAANISISADDGGEVRVDARGGGDVFAYEFVSGTGGSRDVLDRLNPDGFSGNAGLQYPDGRQVFALVPASSATAAMYDPIYSADYAGGGGVDIYGLQAGRSVWLDAAPGIAAGEYVLMPAHYALLPGALRIVENVGAAALPTDGATTLLDGSVLVGGVYGTAGTSLRESERRSFTVQTRDVFLKYSNISTSSGSDYAENQAGHEGRAVPVLPRDAARIVLAPLTTLTASGQFLTDAGKDGRGSQVDIGGTRIRIGAPGAVADPATANYLLLTTDTLANFNANSLSIGALRKDNADGTTSLSVVTHDILVDNNVLLAAPELLLTVGGTGSTITIADAAEGSGAGAILRGTGVLTDSRTGNYVIEASALARPGVVTPDTSGVGSVVRVSSGPERLISREGSFLERNTLVPSTLDIGAGAAIEGAAIALDTSRSFAIDATARIGEAASGKGFALALSADSLAIGGAAFDPAIAGQIAQANSLTLRSPDVIDFTAGAYTFKNLTLDAAGIGLAGSTTWTGGDLSITADGLALRNSGTDLGGCASSVTRACTLGAALTLSAQTIELGTGTFRTYGFGGNAAGQGVTLAAAKGITVTGAGSLSTVNASGTLDVSLTLATPFIAERNLIDVRRENYVRPDYTFASVGAIAVDGTGLAASLPVGNEGPGAHITFSAGNAAANIASDVTFAHTTVRATAGVIDVTANGSIRLGEGGSLQTAGYSHVFDDGIERTTVSAGGGTIRLRSTGIGTVIDAAAGSSLAVDNGTGAAGLLDISASRGAVSLLSAINPGLAEGTRRASSLALDSGSAAFDLSGFATRYGALFGGQIAVRSGAGGLVLDAGNVLRARSVSLTADGGVISVAGTIDTSGDDVSGMKMTDAAYAQAVINGGAISLFGERGVTLAGTSQLRSTTSGYLAKDSRQGTGGTVTIGIGEASGAALTIASGASIDVSATRPGDRLIEATIVDPLTQLESSVYRLAASDLGGSVLLRAPVLAGNTVAIEQSGTITGAAERTVEGYRRWDLDAIAADGSYSGVTLANNVVTLDAGARVAGKANLLADDAAGTVIDFVRSFAVSGDNGDTFQGYRVRPGVELVSRNSVTLGSNWNLAAGEIVNADGTPGYADALAAGLVTESPLGPYTSGPYAGQTRYQVVEGKEAELFERFVSMAYRVGASVRGEAPLISLRAAGDLNIGRSISDGFFAFHDFTNADYLSYQLGGHNRAYHPALALACGAGGAAVCRDSVLFKDVLAGLATPTPNQSVAITIGAAEQGSEQTPTFADAPYTELANAVAASGTGDPFGTAELFPLLSDGTAVHSSDLRLVAGARTDSANVLQVDTALSGKLAVSGESSYRVTITSNALRYGGGLQLGTGANAANRTYFGLEDIIALLDAGAGSDFVGGAYATINWGAGTTGASADARAAALAYAGFSAENFIGGTANPTGVRASLSDILTFLQASGYADRYADGVANGSAGYGSAALRGGTARLQNDTVYVGTVVRTGDGAIAMAAAGDIDLHRTPNVVNRTDPQYPAAFGINAQVGSNAVYTAGVRASQRYLAGAQVSTFTDYPASMLFGLGLGVPLAPVHARDGGSVSLSAGRDILGRRDVWGEVYGQNGTAIMTSGLGSILAARNYPATTALSTPKFSAFGTNSGDQPWRFGLTSQTDTQAAVAFNYFQSGVGALSGGDVTIRAGRDISDLTIALDNSLATTHTTGAPTLVSLGSGDLTLFAGRNLLGGAIDVAQGQARAVVGGDVTGAGTINTVGAYVIDTRNLLRVRVSDATFDLTAGGAVTLGGVGALGLGRNGVSGLETSGFFSPVAGFSATAIGDITYVGNRPDQYIVQGTGTRLGQVLPPSLSLASLAGDLTFATNSELGLPKVLYASEIGELSLFAAGNISNAGLAMSDAPAVNFFGIETYLGTTFPTITADTDDATLRRLHNRRITHLNDPEPARIFAGGSIVDLAISLPKQARIHAGEDIVDIYYYGQNVTDRDVTRISAGRDITGTTTVSTIGLATGRSGVRGNSIVLGGPGALMVEAGRDLGPFITSATGTKRSEAGGIRTIGNEANPWLGKEGADLYAFFGVGKGMDYASLQSVYLDPANLAQLDGDLFEQEVTEAGNSRPNRDKFTYAPVLAQWLADNAPEAFAQVFGSNPPSGDGLKAASYERYAELYAAFTGLDPLARNRFLLDKVYFGELAATSDPDSPSVNRFVRGYRAVQTLFPASRGYTDNLSTYETDPASVSPDHPLGQPTKKLVDGQPAVADTVHTGNVDLRLSTIETARGGDITILGPGGNFIAGSVVRTSTQVGRRLSALNINTEIDFTDLAAGNFAAVLGTRGVISGIPAGFEGVLTLRGGQIRGFSDGSFVLNQSRLFTQAGGDITLWSSNGDLNAGQGPRSASNFPPVVLRFTPNAASEVDSAGSVAGAGIGAFKSTPVDPDATIRLIAPVGTVDAGDAGVRASGNVFVAAARVANADSFSAGGAISGVPALAAPVAAPPPPSAAAAAARMANTLQESGQTAQKGSRIFVDILGYAGSDGTCPDGSNPDENGNCPAN